MLSMDSMDSEEMVDSQRKILNDSCYAFHVRMGCI